MKKHLSKLENLRMIETKFNLFDFENIILPNIYEKVNSKGETYYCINNFCGLNKKRYVEYSGIDLTNFEWDGNEVYICIDTESEIYSTLKVGLIAVNSWKNILKLKFPQVQFDIVMSISDGIEFRITPSITLRLYAIRNEYHYVEADSIENFTQPVLIEQVI
jgi:hypothetical protein